MSTGGDFGVDKVSVADAEADAGAYGKFTFAGTKNKVFAKPGLAVSGSGSKAGSTDGYYRKCKTSSRGWAIACPYPSKLFVT